MAELDAGADGYQAAVKIKQPMLPQISPSPLTSVKIPIGRPNWVYELEHDGFRGILYVDREQAWLVSRKRKKFHQFEPLLKQVRVLPRDRQRHLAGHFVLLKCSTVALQCELFPDIGGST
jgi:ATP-dependent DNA ligase